MNVSTFEELREAIQAMASTITLTNSFSTSGNSILIDHSVFIEGSGFTISRSTSFTGSFFTISNGTVIFSNFTLDGNQQTNVESLINLTGGSLSLEQMTLQNNQSTNGGAINAQSSPSTNFFLSVIGNSIIQNCQATLGGGIYAKFINSNGRDSITVSNQSEIRNNQATLGGGIYLENNDQGFGRINLVNQCVITNNQARDGGGVYYTNSIANQFQSSTTLNLIMNTGAQMTNNQVSGNGGGIYFLSTNVNDNFSAINSSFTQNKANQGGAIFFDLNHGSISPSIQGCDFRENQATNNGGAIAYILQNPSGQSLPTQTSIITMSMDTFIQNQALNGGAFYYQDTISNSPIHVSLNFTNTTLNHNQARDSGGSICILGNSMIETNLVNSRMNQNQANNGGGIYAVLTQNNSPIRLTNVTMTENQAQENGGGIYVQSTSNSTLTIQNNRNTPVTNNSALNGGVIYYLGNANSGVRMEGTFTHNEATNHGGVIDIENSSLTLSDSTLSENKATDGGTIYLSGGNHQITDNTFEENEVMNGGAIYNTNQGNITSTFNTYTMNTATNQGGAIINDEGTIENNGDSFSNNKANNRGGAIYNSGNSTITINDITTILRNQAALGGGIYNTNGGELILRSTEFFQNQATEKGGGIFNDQNSVTKMIDSVSMSENESSQGKDFYNQGRLEIQGLVQMTTGLYLPSEATVPIITNPLSENSRIQLENSTYVTPSTGSPIVIGKADPNQYPLLQDGDANSYQKPPVDFNNWIIRLSDDRKEVWLFLNVVTYAITYCNLNGSTTTNPTTYTENNLPILLTPPTTRRCRVFIGWYLNDQKITTIPVGTTGNLTICARFERVSKSNFRCRNHEFHDRNYSEMWYN